jgi:RNA polymerase sigma-70 factor (ECF subfamily)
MTPTADLRTRPSFLGRLALVPADPAAWEEFTTRYGSLVYQWCRNWGLQPADAEDVTQTVLLDVARGIRAFRYDPTRSFRAWLKTLTGRVWCDWVTARRKAGTATGGESGWDRLASVEARDELLRRLESEHARDLYEAAAALVRPRVRPTTWEAFRLVALDGVAAPDVATRLQMTIGAVYVARSKVQKLLRDEIHRLAGDD